MRLNIPRYLFSVDLEDVRFSVPDGRRFRARVPQMTERILEFLRGNQIKITFFTVGDIAREYPEIIKQIANEGHEIACHTDTHVVLDQHNPVTFRQDLDRNLNSLYDAGASNIIGFRAPCFSLIEQTSWVYEILKELGFVYSSSVLPAPNPIYGWPEFSKTSAVVSGVLELPMTVTSVFGKLMPFGGGVYLRMLPWWLLSRLVQRQIGHSEPLLGYIHPFDIDEQQERFPHPGMENNRFLNALMYYNRRNALKKTQRILDEGLQVQTYRDFVIDLTTQTSLNINSSPHANSATPKHSGDMIANWQKLGLNDELYETNLSKDRAAQASNG